MYKKFIINDKIQNGYYYIANKSGQNFNINLKSDLTPEEKLSLGIFGGKYLNDCIK